MRKIIGDLINTTNGFIKKINAFIQNPAKLMPKKHFSGST